MPQHLATTADAVNTRTLLRASGISCGPRHRPILHEVDLEVERGEIVTIVGPNGSGKTTLLRVAIGAVRPDAGTLERAPDLRIGYCPQKLTIDRTLPLDVDRFLALATPSLRSRWRPEGREARSAALARVSVDHLARSPLTDLSGGEFQRVLLARALLRRPSLLVLDEPTQGLDQPGEAAFYRLIEAVRDETGCGVLMVSHDLHVVMAASDRVLCLNGHVCCAGTPTLVADHPAYRALFGSGTRGALALYRHEHDHRHDPQDHAADRGAAHPSHGPDRGPDRGHERETDPRAGPPAGAAP
ncbi:MAG: metal ABC transporter ATP-binding protein [Geminicoccaceae bacterium]|nr:metal ABC transporter ATP-binding protein [Geminicoccaceae bacterium]